MSSNPAGLLRREKYRDSTFLQLFLDHVGDLLYRDLAKGLKFARVAPPLARLVRFGELPEEEQRYREALVKAHALRAGSYRIAGHTTAAESEYALAFELADTGPISPSARADLYHRLAVLRAVQKRFAEALELTYDAVEICQHRFEHQPELAETLALSEALATLGYVLNEAERLPRRCQFMGEPSGSPEEP